MLQNKGLAPLLIVLESDRILRLDDARPLTRGRFRRAADERLLAEIDALREAWELGPASASDMVQAAGRDDMAAGCGDSWTLKRVGVTAV